MTDLNKHSPKSTLRIVFAGTPEFAASSLEALINRSKDNSYDIVAVLSQPDRPSGRGQKLVASPVKALALKKNIPVFQPIDFKSKENIEQIKQFNADIMIVAAYGIILPKSILEIPKLGCINVHASLLPRWRGAAPIHRALISGDSETGITIMQMDAGLDTGNMLLKASCPISNTETSSSLHDRLSLLGGQTLIEAIEGIKSNTLTPEKQDNTLACYAEKLSKTEGEIDWSDKAKDIALKVRGLNPWPSSYVTTNLGPIKIHEAIVITDEKLLSEFKKETFSPGCILSIEKEQIIVATGEGALGIKQIQLSGSKRLKIQDALNGKFKNTFKIGDSISILNTTL